MCYDAYMRALWIFLRRFWLPITIVIVIILGFAIWVQFSKETNWFAKWVFDFLAQWAIVLSAAVTLMLAMAAFWNISDTRRFRYVESITKSLDGTRGWALDAKRALFLPWWDHQWASQYKLRENLEHVAVRSVFVKSDAELSRLVRNVLPFDSLEMTSVDLIQAMLDWYVEIGCCIFPGMTRRGDVFLPQPSDLLFLMTN